MVDDFFEPNEPNDNDWDDLDLASQPLGTLTLNGADFGAQPGKVLLEDGTAQVQANNFGSTSDATGCTWSSSVIVITPTCVNAPSGILPVGTMSLQVQRSTDGALSNVISVPVFGSVAAITLTSGSAAAAGGSVTLTVAATGPTGAALPGPTVSLKVTSDSNQAQISASQVQLGVGGTAQVTLTDPNPEQVTVQAQYANTQSGNTQTAQTQVSFGGSCANVASINVQEANNQQQATVGTAATVVATADTQSGAPVPGVALGFAATGGTATPATAITNASGQAQAQVAASQSGSVTITVSCAQSGTTGSTQVSFAPPSSSTIALQMTTSSATATVGQSVTLTVTATAGGARIPGVSIQLQPYGSASVTPSEVTTGADGTATASLTDPSAETAQVVASATNVDGQSLTGPTAQASVTFTSAGSSSNTLQSASSCTSPFADVPPSYWAYADICALANSGEITGFQVGANLEFAPDAPLTVEDWAALLTRAFQIPPTASSPGCSIDSSSWAYLEFLSAGPDLQDIAQVSNDGCVATDQINREESVASLVRAMNQADYTLPASPSDILGKFADGTEVEQPVRSLVAIGVDLGLVQGEPAGNGALLIAPRQTLTRAQGAALLYRAVCDAKTGECPTLGRHPVIHKVEYQGGANGNMAFTVVGSGFGFHVPYDAQYHHLRLWDETQNWAAGEGSNWNLNVVSWGPDEIDIAAVTGGFACFNGGFCGSPQGAVKPGDTMQVLVANPQTDFRTSYTFVVGN